MSPGSSIVIIGAGGHAKVAADIAQLIGLAVAGFLDTVNPERQGSPFHGLTVLGGLEQLDLLAQRGVRQAIVAVGDCDVRLRLAEHAVGAGFTLPMLVHPSAVLAADVVVGKGSVLAAGAVVNPGATIGANVIVNTSASVDHDCVIADGVHVAVGARLAGDVRVGRGSWIGMGALVRERLRIGAGVMVGAGALVLSDLPDGVTAYGSPAKVIAHGARHSSVRR
jgi:UDP-N-acetylbacillosamine N-acetyltransferase